LASDDTNAPLQFSQAHSAALHEFGCTVAPIDERNPDFEVHLIVAIHRESDEFAGGLRLLVANGSENRLPVERTLSKLGLLRAGDRLNRNARRPAELSSLWIDRRYRGSGLGAILLRAAVDVATDHPEVDVVSTLSSPHMLPTCLAVGFTMERRFGHLGRFAYPDSRYQSAVLSLPLSGSNRAIDPIAKILNANLAKRSPLLAGEICMVNTSPAVSATSTNDARGAERSNFISAPSKPTGSR
jgi:GNAT superfamily N-acetyltransferase